MDATLNNNLTKLRKVFDILEEIDEEGWPQECVNFLDDAYGAISNLIYELKEGA